ncbi:MAG: hypothetical protein MZW92_57005 [Comamonadaceae bacterium]|nr:hypothetical protein [Comamonadaceae bacterium]
MRIGAPEFGPAALLLVRVAGAAALLLPLVIARGEGGALRRHWQAADGGRARRTRRCRSRCYIGRRAGAQRRARGDPQRDRRRCGTALVAWAWLGDRPRRPARRRPGGWASPACVAVGPGTRPSLKPGEHGVSAALGHRAVPCWRRCATGFGRQLRRSNGWPDVPPLAVAGRQPVRRRARWRCCRRCWLVRPTAQPSAARLGSAAAALALAVHRAWPTWMYFRLIAPRGAGAARSPVTFLDAGCSRCSGARCSSARRLTAADRRRLRRRSWLGTALATGVVRAASHLIFVARRPELPAHGRRNPPASRHDCTRWPRHWRRCSNGSTRQPRSSASAPRSTATSSTRSRRCWTRPMATRRCRRCWRSPRPPPNSTRTCTTPTPGSAARR